MTPAHRKLNFAAHVTSSVGWLGAVASFLVLSIAGLTSGDAEIVRGAYLAMNLIGQFIIVPLSLVARPRRVVQHFCLCPDWPLVFFLPHLAYRSRLFSFPSPPRFSDPRHARPNVRSDPQLATFSATTVHVSAPPPWCSSTHRLV